MGCGTGMDLARPLPEQAVARHRIEDSRLAEQHDQHDGAETGERAGIDDVAAPTHAGFADGQRDRSADVQPRVVHRSGEKERDEDVENGADDERAEDADRHVALGIARLLRRGGDGVEADVGEEDDARGADHATPADRPAARRDAGWPWSALDDGRQYPAATSDEGYDREELDEDDGGVEVRRLLDADDEDRGDDEDGKKGEQIECAVA